MRKGPQCLAVRTFVLASSVKGRRIWLLYCCMFLRLWKSIWCKGGQVSCKTTAVGIVVRFLLMHSSGEIICMVGKNLVVYPKHRSIYNDKLVFPNSNEIPYIVYESSKSRLSHSILQAIFFSEWYLLFVRCPPLQSWPSQSNCLRKSHTYISSIQYLVCWENFIIDPVSEAVGKRPLPDSTFFPMIAKLLYLIDFQMRILL